MSRLPQTRILAAPAWETILRQAGLDHIEGFTRLPKGDPIKQTATTRVSRLACTALPGQNGSMPASTWFVKEYMVTESHQLWSGFFRGTFLGTSKVRREFDNLARLRTWDLDAPAPVACAEQRRCGWLIHSWLLTEAVPQAVSLDLFIRDTLANRRDARSSSSIKPRRELIDSLADSVRRLHAHRFVHGDLFWRNILLTQDAPGRYFLIDAHAGRVWHCRANHHRARDLATLDAPAPSFFRRSERLRFFLRYLGHSRLSRADKALLARVLRYAAPQRERQLARLTRAGS
jgi:tRNA A-37 threonylcarbamoyl transferase component Bud32